MANLVAQQCIKCGGKPWVVLMMQDGTQVSVCESSALENGLMPMLEAFKAKAECPPLDPETQDLSEVGL